MAQPGQDADFNFSFDDEEAGGAAKKGANAFGGAPRGREAPPPPDMHEEFDALPDSPTGFGGQPSHHETDDSFGDVGAGDEHGASPVQFADEEPVEGAPPIYAEADSQGFGDQETVEHFGEDAVDFEHDSEHAAGDHGDDDENVLRHADQHQDEDHELADAPAVAQRSLLSRLIYPIGGVALLGAVGYFAWGYVSPMFFGSPAVQTAQGPQRIQMPPTSAAPNAMPAGGAVAQRPSMPQPIQNQQPPAVAAPKPLQQQFGSAQVTSPPAVQPAQPAAQPPAAPPIQLATAVPDSMTGMNRPQPQSEEALKGISSQLEVISSNIGRVSSRLEVLERAAQADRSDFAGRIAALESRPQAPVTKAAPPQSSEIALPSIDAKPATAKGTKAPSLVSEPKAKPAPAKAESDGDERAPSARRAKSTRARHAKAESDEGAEPGDVAMAGDEPPAKPVRLSAYRLQAASEISGRTIVSVRYKGRTEEFTVGQTIPGAGEIRSIRQNGGSWVVVTSRGVIVE